MDEYLGLCVSEDILDVPSPENKPTLRKYPLLKQFASHADKISHPRYISNGEEGIVFSFKMKGWIYFKPWDFPQELFPIPVSPKVAHLLSPFGRESRAFARLCDLGLNGTWAVRCHGWIFLSDGQIACLSQTCKRLNLTPGLNVSRWAIVKDLLPCPPTQRDLVEIRSKFDIARRAIILPGDVEARNYRGSFFVDLGSSTTYPFPGPWWSDFEFEHFFSMCPPKVGERWVIEP